MLNRSLRRLLLGSAVTVGLVASAGMAQAVEYNFGGLKLNLDTTVSAGTSIRTATTDSTLLSSVDGGPKAGTVAVVAPGTPTGLTLPLSGTATAANPTGAGAAMDIGGSTVVAGSTNSTDGRLNFNRGDFTSAIVKMTNDLSASWQNYHFFGRLSSYYDAVLSQDSSYARSKLIDGKADAARDIRLLDFYVSGDYEVANLPLNVRAGKQVISWGETTFMLNGINSINPIDVNAFRRPGSEVKEGLVPVWALDASIGLPYNLSLEAFYQLKWEPYQLDRAGTPFSSSDSATTGSDIFGSYKGTAYITSDLTGNFGRNCETTTPDSISAMFTAAYVGTNAAKDCNAATFGTAADPYVDYTNPIPVGLTEWVKNVGGDVGGMILHEEDKRARNSGQWGVAARWYSEDLNNTEFGLYFMNYHSRLPFASERYVTRGASDMGFTSYLLTNDTSSGTARGTNPTGCNLSGTTGLPVFQTNASLGQLNVQSTAASAGDIYGVYAAAKNNAQAYYDGIGAASPFATVNGGISGAGALAAINGANGTTLAGINTNSALEMSIINCALVAQQTNAAGLLQNGAEMLNTMSVSGDSPLRLFLEYPEDIHMVGFSFNTTVGTWGVQGEMSYRSNAPMQLDTDQITIAALKSGCVLSNVATPSIDSAALLDTYGGAFCGVLGSSGAAATKTFSGVTRSKMFTFDVGTTATYTNSNSFVNMTGADLGILVTEVGLVYAPDAPSEGNFKVQQWANVCTGGTDLPSGGTLSLAYRTGCRPTAASWGYVLLGQLQYNNAFGTAITLNPTVAFSHDVSGNTPAPYGNYRQGRKSVSLQLNGSYQSAWKGGISYTNYFGNDKYNDAVDRDFAAINISYAF